MANNGGTLDSSATSTPPPELKDDRMEQENDEDESLWLPLSEEQNSESNATQSATMEPAAPARTTLVSSSTIPRPRGPQEHRESVQAIQQRWETKQKIRKSFVQHPLDQSWGTFARHLVRELWSLDLQIRVGIVLVLVGAIMQLVVLSLRWYQPRLLFLLAIFLVSFIYLAPQNVERQLGAFLSLMADPAHLMDYMNANQFKRLFLASCLVPTLLEMKTFGFLSQVMVDAGWKWNLVVAAALMILQVYRRTRENMPPRDCIQQGILLLYGASLLVSLIRLDIHRLPALMGPFCLSTGTLLIFYHDDDMTWFTRAVRHALRLTLRDVLASVGQSVQEDEMLRLAMLRWIVDYWSSSPTAASTTTSDATTMNEQGTTTSAPSSVPSTTLSSASSLNAVAVGSAPTQPTSAPQDPGLHWEELSPMLDMTTDQMLEEVPHGQQATTAASASMTSASSTSSMRLPTSQENQSMLSLKSMLSSMDVDDRAKPAVMAYKRAVQDFPPSRSTAMWLSIIRRCPASLVLMYRYLSDSPFAFASTPILLSFVVMEVFRVLEWSEACQQSQGQGGTAPGGDGATTETARASVVDIPNGMDPMLILLSGDDFSLLRPPTLLQVWQNIRSSVTALEMGLTAARCAHTTVAAADFAGNIMSLAQLGVEVSQRGLGHGLGVLAKELIHLHVSQGSDGGLQRDRSNPNIRYTTAAVGAIRSGSIVARNVQALADDEHAHPSIRNVAGAAMFLSGRGWIHGRDGHSERPSTDQERLTIEVLPDETVEPPSDAHQSSPGHDSGDTKSDDCSEVMELIALASEKELITEDEKDAFMESLAVSRTTPDPDAAKATSEGIKKTLICLLQHSSELESVGIANPRADIPPTSGQQATVEEGNGTVGHEPKEPGPVEEMINAEESAQLEVDISNAPASLPSLALTSTITSNDGPSQCSAPFESSPIAATNETSSEELDAVVGTSDERQEAAEPALASETEFTGQPASRGAPSEPLLQRQERNSDVGKWIGGGLALLGGVVAGIALVNRPQDEGTNRDRVRNSNRRGEEQTVTIEEIDDDSEDWVDVAAGVRGEVSR